MALPSHKTEIIGNESLEGWEPVGSGGFGVVYKARHKEWGRDVAIKILRDGFCSQPSSSTALCDEANHMEKVPCEFVLMLLGKYQGCPPIGETSMKQGIVIQFMERGSVQSLLKDLSGPPPWPLAFRLVHQVALGMNFLHSRELVHRDLKPSNVLLNDDLKAKISDFGLSRVSTSALSSYREAAELSGGSHKYMPPEAFDVSYEPVRAYDIYSYGILLWSILTGKEPYPAADYSLVKMAICEGQRPHLEDIDHTKAEGLDKLVGLMQKCWDGDHSKRPPFKESLTITEDVLLKHKKGIPDAVHQVLKRLESPTSNEDSNSTVASSSPLQTPEQSTHDTVDFHRFPKSEKSSIQDSVNNSPKRMDDTKKDLQKAKFVDDNRNVVIQRVSEVMAIVEYLGREIHGETYSNIKAKPTPQQQMRELYDTALRSGGTKVKAAFYDALKQQQPALVENLGGHF